MKKKIILCMLTLALALSLTACGKEDKDAEKGSFKVQQDKKDDKKDTKDVKDEDIKDEDVKDKDSKDEDQTVAKRGTFDGNVYTNESMGIQLTFPENCVMSSDGEIAQVVENGSDLMEETYDSETLEKSMSGTIYDVIASTPDESTNIQVLMENTKITVGRRISAEIYAQALAENIKVGYQNAGIDVGEPTITEETLGGLDFLAVSLSVSGMTQEYHVYQVDDYIFGLILTYTDDGATAEEFLNSVTAL